MIKVLVDTTYLLPTFGISVENLTDRDLINLKKLKLEGSVDYFCIDIIWIELLGKLWKMLSKGKSSEQSYIEIGIESLKKSDFYNWLPLSTDAIFLAFRLRSLGHRDIIDNLLYATAVVEDMVFMSMDNDLKLFLEAKGFNVDRFLNHRELIDLVKRK